MMGPSLVGGGTSFTAIRDRLLRRKADGGDHHLITSSGTWTKADHIARLKSDFGVAGDADKINIDNIWMRLYAVGGGGGGAYGAPSCCGGFPGIVMVREFWLHELPETVAVTIGAGGTPGNWGGSTIWNANPLEYVTTEGVSRGANDQAEFKQLYGWMKGKGLDPSIYDLTQMGWSSSVPLTGEWLRPNSAKGPGIGGSGLRSGSGGPGSSTPYSPREGGNSGMRSAGGWRRGGFASAVAADRHGADHNPLFADSYGAGGVGAMTLYANPLSGNGGFPGGGGGSGDAGGIGVAGTGGNGCVKIMSFIREAV
jgi:hypothetical protein